MAEEQVHSASSPPEPRWSRRWAWQIGFLFAISALIFITFYALDYFVTHGGPKPTSGILGHYLDFDPTEISDAISGLTGVVGAVLAIVITVVSIVVQLSADRYTGVAQMFLRDRINVLVMTYYVVASAVGVWVSVSLKGHFVARATLLMMMGAVTFGLLIMLPYFAYVFWFVEPGNIVRRIRRDAVANIESAAGGSGRRCQALQSPTLHSILELADIISNSISGKDKIIASRAVDALKDFGIEYLSFKDELADEWFVIGEGIADNPDLVAMENESLRDLETRRTWLEWQVLRQYLNIYGEALPTMRDINYLIAIDTRYLGEAAGEHRDEELIELVFRFMNSYIRATLNARDVRTAYNILNQYRMLIETMLRQGHFKFAEQGVAHLTYYGHLSYDMKLVFVTETIAYDISSLCQSAHALMAPVHDAMLSRFLQLDRPLRSKSQEPGLLGVRKAQVKVAAYYLQNGADEHARLIADDMSEEPKERLATIRDALAGVTTKEFWEISDRGRNFEYMPPEQRAHMATLFEWLEVPAGPADAPNL